MGFIFSAISMGAVFLFGCVGEIITEKAGNLNLGIPGIMCLGAAGGCVGISIYMGFNTNIVALDYACIMIISIIFSVIFSGIGALIYSFLTVTLRSNQNVTGLALTTFGAGLTQFIFKNFVGDGVINKAANILTKTMPYQKNIGFICIAIIIAVLASLFLKKNRKGLNLRAVGENPATADAVGLNVTKYKYLAIFIGSAIAGLGGLFYVLDIGGFDNTLTIQGLGWLSIALVIFTMWKPSLAILGSVIFGALYIVSAHIGVERQYKELIKLLPYIITVIVLIFTSIFGGKSVQPPASLGVNYFREER